MKSVILLHHLGLGDHLICNGLVRAYIQEEGIERLFLPCKVHNLPTVRFMYRDLENLFLLPVQEFHDVEEFVPILGSPLVKVGFENTRTPDWDTSFYDSIGLEMSSRWDAFHVDREMAAEKELLETLNPTNEPYILIHDESSVKQFDLGLTSEQKQIRIKKEQTSNLFDYCALVQHAEEVHCINSSFIHLVESIGTTARCFFHIDSGSECNEFETRLAWTRLPIGGLTRKQRVTI